MKNLRSQLLESLNIYESEVDSEESFKEYAENKFKEVFGDDLDEDQMNKTIKGIISKCDKDWGKAVGMLNKSFGK